MKNKIWLMEGLSSQRDIIDGIRQFSQQQNKDLTIYASHRHKRTEILSQADFSLIEPQNELTRLDFIKNVVKQTGVTAIHVGRNCQWFEAHRGSIEALGVALTTGALSLETFAVADDKATFAQFMQQKGLPVVPSIRISNLAELKAAISDLPFQAQQVCVKPVQGIYGKGFWIFDESASPMALFNHPENRRVNVEQYLSACESSETFEPLVLMPYLPGPEYSVDMLVDNGNVLAAVARCKQGPLQYLENSGQSYQLGCACAQAMGADGLVNVQTRIDENGNPVLLEINMRPSGGIGYTRHSGVNLAGLFAFFKLGYLSAAEVSEQATRDFHPAIVRSLTNVVAYDPILSNQLTLATSTASTEIVSQ